MEIERVKERVMEGRPGFTRDYGPQRADHQPGIPFWPQEIYRDLVVILLLVAITFFLSAYVTPFLGPARSPQLSEIIVPDWYLLFSWGLLKVADIFPQFTLGPAEFNPQFWGDILSGIPIIALLLLPFLDRGRESRPAEAPLPPSSPPPWWRSGAGGGGLGPGRPPSGRPAGSRGSCPSSRRPSSRSGRSSGR